jgi:nitrogen regulatory protein P-II 1
MKMIMAIIRPEKLEAVKKGLSDVGVEGITITDVRGHGTQSGIRITTRVGSTVIDEIEKTKVETVVDDALEQPCIDAIISAANTGHFGDGRIFVIPVERSIRVRQE